MRTSRYLIPLTLLILLLAATVAWAGEPVRLDLPRPAKLAVSDRDSVAIVPLVTVTEEAEPADDPEIQRELARYLRRTIERSAGLDVSVVDAQPPTHDLVALREAQGFWQAVGDRTDATWILAGAVDLDLEDRAGYVTREFTSDEDGRTYHAQVLVERAGVTLDLLLWVFEGQTGRLRHTENLKDFRAFQGESVDPLDGLFANLTQLEHRIAGLFAAGSMPTERFLQ